MGRKLLVADDSVTIQKVIRLALSSEGYDISAAADGKEALRVIQEQRPDIVLIDVALPEVNAYAVKRAVSEHRDLTHIGFILMASAFERLDEKACDEADFKVRLIKPFDPSHLRKAVSDLLVKLEALKAASPVVSAPPPPPPIELMQEPVVPPEPSMIETVEDERLDPLSGLHEPAVSRIAVTEPISLVPPPPLDNDIKNLTESTIKMSGLDDFEWSLDDSRKMKKISEAPPQSPPLTASQKAAARAAAAGEPPKEMTRETTRSISVPLEKRNLSGEWTRPSPYPIDDGGSNFPLNKSVADSVHEITASRERQAPPSGANLVSGKDYVAPTIELTLDAKKAIPSAPSMPITRAEIEQLIRKDIEASIQKIARESVLQIAEAVIRSEIEKILSETHSG